MNLHRRIISSFSLYLVILFLTILLSYFFFNQRRDSYYNNEYQKKLYSVEIAMRLKAEGMIKFENEFTFWDDLVNFVDKPDSGWAEENITSLIPTVHMQYVWIYNKKLEQTFSIRDSVSPDFTNPILPEKIPLVLDIAANSQKRFCHFYTKRDSDIVEITGATIHYTNDSKRLQKPEGFFLVGRIINRSFLSELEVITNTKVNIAGTDKIDSLKSDNYLIIHQPLKDWKNEQVCLLTFTSDDKFVRKENKANMIFLGVYVLIILIGVVNFYFLVITRVSRPLSNISKCLDTGNTEFINKTKNQTDEFGKIAGLIDKFFLQKQELVNEIEERKRLMDDLKEVNCLLEEQNVEISMQKEEIQAQADFLQEANEAINEKNREIIRINLVISKKNKNIVDSIQYAQYIQSALLPNQDLFRNSFSDFFILYKPRDIVSGDFYWIKHLRNFIYVVAADCTGHGVPGAFMSVLGISILNEIVTKSRMDKPSEILDHFRILLKKTLHQTGEESEAKDGIDIALCAIDLETYMMQFAGAYHPLYVIKNKMLLEIKGDRMPIGVHRKEKSFSHQEIQLEKGDKFYIFSDGFISQFGGANNQKFKAKQFKELLLKNYNLPMEEQKFVIEDSFNHWKGEREQIDDILVMGIRL